MERGRKVHIFTRYPAVVRILLFMGLLFLGSIILIGKSNFESYSREEQERVRGEVVQVESIPKREADTYLKQRLAVSIREDGKQEVVTVEYSTDTFSQLPLKKGDQVFLTKTVVSEEETTYYVADRFRLYRLIGIVAIFLLFVFIAAGSKGLGSIFGLIVSIAVIMLYIIPAVINGQDPILASVIGAIVIMIASIYPAHGISRQTTVAVLATAFSLFITLILSKLLVSFMMLHGYGSEEAYAIQELNKQIGDIRALLIGGIVIATLGALDDVTTAQSAAVFELSEANSAYTVTDLMKKGYKIGREHVVSLINTLVIVYVGSSLVVFLYYHLLQAQVGLPLFYIFNTEFVVEEVVKAIAISAGLILAVPITTILAALVVKERIWFPEKRHFLFLFRSFKGK